MGYALSTTLDLGFDEALTCTRAALAEQGFGILTEIDLRATLKAKIDVDIAAQVILGACRPALAHAALQAEPSIGLLLPCTVLVRSIGQTRTLIQALDPDVMVELTANQDLAPVAAEARTSISAALTSLSSDS
jgi:uncharacterized protein (DUF302 family)